MSADVPAGTVEARDLAWSVKGRPILVDAGLTAPAGSVVGLLGPNGSGKTSMLRILAGLRRPDDGTVRLDDTDLHRIPRRHLARRLAIVEQSHDVHADLTVRDVVALGRTPYRPRFGAPSRHDEEAVDAALALTGLDGFASRSWATLSGGERQRTQLARALAQRPGVVVLDEPTNHLDIRYQLELLELLRSLRITVIAALHELNLASRYCDEIVVLAQGRTVAAGPAARTIDAILIDEVYGVRAVVETSRHTGSPVATYLAPSSAREPVREPAAEIEAPHHSRDHESG